MSELIDGSTAASMCVDEECRAEGAEERNVCIRGLLRLAREGWGVGRCVVVSPRDESECSLLLRLRSSSAYLGMRAAPALCAEPSRAERAAVVLDGELLRALAIFDMGAVTRDMTAGDWKLEIDAQERERWMRWGGEKIRVEFPIVPAW